MTQQELTLYNLGENLDQLMNLDPRGYGVCRILYPAARALAKEPLTVHGAKFLVSNIKEADLVYIITGFVLLPFKKAEMDGIVSSVLLARSLVKAFGAKPVLICPEEDLEAAKALAYVAGLHCYDSVEEVQQFPISMALIPFPKDREQALLMTDQLIAKGLPAAMITNEAPGANASGVYHNATGLDVTDLEAKTDLLFERLQQLGIPNLSIGDLGNEIGMGTLEKHLNRYVPYTAPGTCRCGCKGGIAAATKADHILTATVSDWGCYGLMAALAYLKRDIDVFHTPEMEREALTAACRNGVIDMYGWLIPAIDGMNAEKNCSIVSLMRECVFSAMDLEKTCATWFDKVLELGYYDNVADCEGSKR